ncbi:MAG: M14 family zinc carboxypeptidase [Gemmatimonadota bacterium]|nr:M14 family zinc carboxypeptidase [Gemmatimonadota bacterium]
MRHLHHPPAPLLPSLLPLLALGLPLTAQSPTPPPQTPPPFHLATLFDLGHLLLDENGDGVPDRLGASIILPPDPTDAERAAAAEITARLGFETMSLDLPVRRGLQPGRVGILIGLRALDVAGLSPSDFGLTITPPPDPPDPGQEGEPADPGTDTDPDTESPGPDSTPAPAIPPDPPPTVVTLTAPDGARWVAVLGGNDEALLRAARHLAGSLPHVSNLSGPSLQEVTNQLGTWLAGTDSTAPAPTLDFHHATLPDSTNHVHFTATLAYDDDPGATRARYALDRLQILAWERVGENADGPGSDDLRFRDLASLTFEAAGRQVILPTLVTPSPSGPGSRPRGGAKGGLDLSNLYTTSGFLGGGQIPSAIDVVVVPGRGAEGIPDLTARMTLETTGFTVPIVRGLDEIRSPSAEPTAVLVGSDNPHITELIDSGTISIDDLGPGRGLIEAVPDGFGGKRALVVTGADAEGAALATKRLAEVFPNVSVRGDGKPTFDDIEHELWGTLSGYTPGGQAAFGLYKLDQVMAELTGELAEAGERIASAEILMSLWKPSDGVAGFVRDRALAHFPDSIAPEITVTIDNRDVQNASTIIDDQFEVPSEVDRFWTVFNEPIAGHIEDGEPVHLEARLSEPPEIRASVAAEARRRLIDAGADPDATTVQVLSAFKQGFSWLRESVAPRLAGRDIGEIVIEFLRNDPPEEWPHQSIHTPLRWLHEIFPIDEVLVADMGLDLGQIRFEMADEGPIYRVHATAPDGSTLLEDTFNPVWVLRPYFDRFRDYEQVRVTTGWVTAISGTDTLVHERIITDPEWVWDRYQASTLPAIWDYVMDRHDARPRGGPDAPFFGTLTIDLELSEPDYRLGIDNEIIAPMDALHEEFYFGTIEFFTLTGRNAQGGGLSYPGRIIPVMRPKGDGAAGRGHITMTGFAASRPTVIVRYETAEGTTGERRRDITKVSMGRPSLYRAVIAPAADGGAGADSPALPRLDFSIEVDSEKNLRDSLVALASAEAVDRSWVSAEQIVETVTNLGALREAGLYRDALAYHDVGEMRVRVEWDEEEDEAEEDEHEAPEDSLEVEADSLQVEEDSSWVTAILPDNGFPAPLPVWTDLLPEGWSYQGERIVQWETPIPPPEGHEMTAMMSQAFDEAHMYHAGESYLGRQIWAMDLMSPIAATHWSRVKATTFKPTVIYSAREHANEVSSTSHVLRHAELLLTDSVQRARLDKVNVVIHPFTNPDGAQLAYDLYRITPDYILHAGYLGSLGVGVGGGFGSFPIYPESTVRNELWGMWFPDIFLNPHGYPSHQVVQLFSEYSGLVRGGRVTERNWGFNKGWFMPGFSYIDDPSFPRHKDAAFKIRDYITAGINSNRDVFEMNQRTYDRYRRYGADFDNDEVFRLPMTDSVMIHMPLKGSAGFGGGGSFSPRITIWNGITEAPDETAHGPWMELVAKAGLSWDQAILDYLYDGDHEVDRSGSAFRGGATLRMNRARPPREKKEDEGGEDR